MKGVSIIICCYNSAGLLPETLKHIADQINIDDIDWELIIVNNASTDNTRDVALNLLKAHALENVAKVVDERNPGLINARLKGIDEARYDFLIFCDDDNWLDKNYLNNAVRIMSSSDKIGACGGVGYPVFESGHKPDWFTPLILQAYAIGAQGDDLEGVINIHRNYLYGAGIVIRKELIKDIYQKFNHTNFLLSGRSGKALAAGDDSAISFFILMHGYQLWFSSNLIFGHFLTARRLQKDYAIKMHKGFGVALVHIKLYHAFLPSTGKLNAFIFSHWFLHLCKQGFNYLRDRLAAVTDTDKLFIAAMQLAAFKELFANKRQLQKKKKILKKTYSDSLINGTINTNY